MVFNFLEISRSLVEAGGAIQVKGIEDLSLRLKCLLSDEGARKEVGEKGYQFLQKHRGTAPDSLLPSLRPDKEEGQANFVNPGIFLANAGADFDLTPKLKGVVNVNWMRFMHTEPIEDLLFQAPIHDDIGLDYSLGFEYRPPLTENILLRGGASALSPEQGFRDIYSGKTLVSLFANVRFQF